MSTKTLVRVIDDTPKKAVINTIDHALQDAFKFVKKGNEARVHDGISVEWTIIQGEEWVGDPPTDAQIDCLDDLHVNYSHDITKGEASKLIRDQITRQAGARKK